ncbi:ABC transporter substrate-binding protein [Brevibacterium otitidis]|uniref:ABC transporter substrate-binding protein n=1 Tax=Brevibacterium otitidis TaxID=53364 RepID=A0ABV5X065_9MICO|nr:ABC transporter substrate-binding protein [Brevibacterium otitidis]
MAPLPRRRFLTAAGLTAAAAGSTLLSGCVLTEPLVQPPQESRPEPGTRVRVGSQSYYSSVVVAEIYAQALEHAGAEVDRQFMLGQREDYLPTFMAGGLEVFPEYGGHLLQYFRPDLREVDSAQIQLALQSALPTNLRVLTPAEAADHERFVVLREFGHERRLVDIGELRDLDEPLKIAAGAHVRRRPYGPRGLEETYGVKAEYIDTIPGDTIAARDMLTSGEVQVAFISAADPALESDTFLPLADPRMLVLAQLITPLVVPSLHPHFTEALARVNLRLDTTELQHLNGLSHYGMNETGPIARDWLQDKELLS